MKESISNSTLVVLLVIAIGVSVLGIWVSVSGQGPGFTGAATSNDSGTVELSVSGTVGLVVTDALINQTVTVDANSSSCYVMGNGTQGTGCILDQADGITFENTGNTLILNVTAYASKNADEIIVNATSASISYLAQASEVGACGSYASNPLSNQTVLIATNCNFGDTADESNVYLIYNFTSDAAATTETAQVTFIGTA
ncbi:hypothetical protein GF342_04475 [Candidatus Woesearchaeota archaeon]|nr:hypothetical protein [Candidatus Woesearchaeota archaeon]